MTEREKLDLIYAEMNKSLGSPLLWVEKRSWLEFKEHLKKHHQRAYMDDKELECLNVDIDMIANLIDRITTE